MVEYIGTQFELVTRTINDLLAITAGKFDKMHSSLTALPEMAETVGGLASRVSSLENKISTQNDQLIGLHNDRLQLLSTIVEGKLDNLCNNFSHNVNSNSSKVNACNRGANPAKGNYFIDVSIRENANDDDCDSGDNTCANPRLSSANNNNVKRSSSRDITDPEEEVRCGGLQLVVSSIYEGNNDNIKEVAYAYLATVLPSLRRSDITEARPLRDTQTSTTPSTSVNGNSITCRSRSSPWLVQLRDSDTLNSILRAKKNFTSYHTRSVNVTSLSGELADSLVTKAYTSKICENGSECRGAVQKMADSPANRSIGKITDDHLQCAPTHISNKKD